MLHKTPAICENMHHKSNMGYMELYLDIYNNTELKSPQYIWEAGSTTDTLSKLILRATSLPSNISATSALQCIGEDVLPKTPV